MEGVFPLSKSWVSTWQKCPFRAWVERTKGIQQRSSPAAEFGVKCHALWADFLLGNEAKFSDYSPEIREFVSQARKLHPKLPEKPDRQWVEVWVGVEDGFARTNTKADAVLHGFMDWVFQVGRCVVNEDLKTGRWETENEFERHAYAVLSWALVPDASEWVFRYFWARSGNMPSWTYESGDIKEAVDHVGGIVEQVRDSDPDPNPGPQCDNWYGQPCLFRDFGCPAKAVQIVSPEEIVSARDMLEGFMSDPERANETVVSRAVGGLMALDGFKRRLNAACKKWANAHQSVTLQDGQTWGVRLDHKWETDTEKALRIMLREGMTLGEIARFVSLNQTNIQKMARDHGSVLDKINAGAVFDAGEKRTYGIVKEHGNETA
jgi:hypothetical protein